MLYVYIYVPETQLCCCGNTSGKRLNSSLNFGLSSIHDDGVKKIDKWIFIQSAAVTVFHSLVFHMRHSISISQPYIASSSTDIPTHSLMLPPGCQL